MQKPSVRFCFDLKLPAATRQSQLVLLPTLVFITENLLNVNVILISVFFKAILLEVLVSLETIKQQNTTVLQILQAGKSPGAQVCEAPDIGTLPLPLQSVPELRGLEQRICAEPELKKTMVRGE